MSDVLIRDVPDDVVTAIDERATSLGLSRSEFLRRKLQQEAHRSAEPVTVADLQRLGETARDLADPEVMRRVWS